MASLTDQLDKEIAKDIFISDEEFNKQLDDKVDYVKKVCAEENKDSFMPMLIVSLRDMRHGYEESKKGLQTVVVAFADLDDNRHKMMTALGVKFYEDMTKKDGLYPVCIFFMVEAWTRKMGLGEQMPDGMRVKDFEDKKEVIVTSGVTADCRVNGAMQDIERTDDGKIIIGETVVTHLGDKDGYTMEPMLLYRFYQGWMMAMAKDFGWPTKEDDNDAK